jgi:hypothetical protein
MTDQLSMFDAVPPRFPRARREDPRSSHEAAALVERTGGAKAQAEAVLEALRRFPMSTSAELSKAMREHRQMPARRLPELAKAGLVTRHNPTRETTPCAVTGLRCVRWRVA